MNNLLQRLNDCLDRQIHRYGELLDLFIAERGALLTSDLEALNAIITEKEKLLQNIRREELERQRVGDDIAGQLELDPEDLSITRLSRRVAEPQASQILKRGSLLQKLIEEIQTESERNRSLCLQALQFVNGSIKMLSTLAYPNRLYHPSGRVQNDGQIGRMLSSAV